MSLELEGSFSEKCHSSSIFSCVLTSGLNQGATVYNMSAEPWMIPFSLDLKTWELGLEDGSVLAAHAQSPAPTERLDVANDPRDGVEMGRPWKLSDQLA